MQIVIDIPEEVKQVFDNAESNELKGGYYDHGGLIGKAIKNGTPLPKGHGRLIDADALYDQFAYADYDFDKTLEYAPTIIEAESEGRND